MSTTKLLALSPELKIDSLLLLIAQNKLYIDLKRFRLTESDTTAIFTNYELCQAYSAALAHKRKNHDSIIDIDFWKAFIWDGNPYLVINAGHNEITVSRATENAEYNSPLSISRKDFIILVEQGKISGVVMDDVGISTEAMMIMNNASPKQLQKANWRFKVIEPIVVDGLKLSAGDVSSRVVRDWVRKYHLAEKKYETGFVGLIDNNPGKGNYGPKLLPEVLALLENVISEEYENNKNPKQRIVYGRLLIELETNNLPSVSYKTFKRKISERRGPEQTEKMQGARAAEQVRPTYHYLEFETPRHGSYPMSILHIDHTQLDIVLKDSQTSKVLGKPWLSIAICTFTRQIVAFTLSYDSPSKRTCMVLLREIVRRNHRLPNWIVVDNGAEFGSVYFETTTAFYKCHIMKRPPGKPRFGSVCERIFGTTNTQLIYNLAGNTQIMKRVRIVTKSHNPENLATWTLLELHMALEEYFYEVYDTIEHPALRGQKPREAYAQGCTLHGYRNHNPILYDEHFINHTYPTTDKGTAKINPIEGVKINYHYYWSEQFRDGNVAGSNVPVRYDPFDASIAKVLVGKRWVTCISAFQVQFAGRSEREIQILSNELKAQDTKHSRTFNITSKKLAENIIKAEAANTKVALQRMKDLEGERVFKLIQGGKSTREKMPKNADIVTVLPIVSATPSQKTDAVSQLVILEDW